MDLGGNSEYHMSEGCWLVRSVSNHVVSRATGEPEMESFAELITWDDYSVITLQRKSNLDPACDQSESQTSTIWKT